MPCNALVILPSITASLIIIACIAEDTDGDMNETLIVFSNLVRYNTCTLSPEFTVDVSFHGKSSSLMLNTICKTFMNTRK